MSTRQTRRSAKVRAAATPEDNDSQILMNGDGAAHDEAPDASESGPRENIFLFWPNIIGMKILAGLQGHTSNCSPLRSRIA
jgi:CDP-diacylglycerol--inositol 3-phosphatidyltransferase